MSLVFLIDYGVKKIILPRNVCESNSVPLPSLCVCVCVCVRYQTISSVCGTQTGKEQHAAAQAGHSADRHHEPDSLCGREVSLLFKDGPGY